MLQKKMCDLQMWDQSETYRWSPHYHRLAALRRLPPNFWNLIIYILISNSQPFALERKDKLDKQDSVDQKSHSQDGVLVKM